MLPACAGSIFKTNRMSSKKSAAQPAAKKAASKPAAKKAAGQPAAKNAATKPAAKKDHNTEDNVSSTADQRVHDPIQNASILEKAWQKDETACRALVPDVDEADQKTVLAAKLLYGKISVNELP